MALTAVLFPALLALLIGIGVFAAAPIDTAGRPVPTRATRVHDSSRFLHGPRLARVGFLALGLLVGLIHPLLLVIGVLTGVGIPWWRKRTTVANLASQKVQALPATLDLLAVVLGSGGTIVSGVRVVAHRGDPVVRPMFEQMLQRREAGQSLVTVLNDAPGVLGEPYRPLARALVATERDGAPVATLLVRLAEEAGSRRQREAEARAKVLSVRLLFPLVVCFLPAVLLGAVAPLVIVAAGRFLG